MWSGIPISLRIFQFVVMHKGFSVVNEAEVDVFLKFPCFFYDLINVGNLTLVSLPFLNKLVHQEVLSSRTVEV